jgi:hypothetical protein
MNGASVGELAGNAALTIGAWPSPDVWCGQASAVPAAEPP